MPMHNYITILLLFSFSDITLANKEFQLTNRHFFHYIHCNDSLHIKINSIKYFYHKYNCTFIIHDNNHDRINLCTNQSSCILDLKSLLFFHTQHHFVKCHTIKLKSIQLNYSCVNDQFISVNILTQPKKTNSGSIYAKHTIIICLCLIILLSLFAFICTYIQNCSTNKSQFKTQSIYDNQNKFDYELKILSLIESSSSSTTSSSSSTLASVYNKNSITYPSEYDNITKDTNQLSESQSPLKVKFNENYQLK